MPGLTDSFLTSKSFTFIAAAMAFLAAAILLSVIFRFVIGHKVRLARNGRGRLPRLGTVDVFDLDRQRQLVIVRRDNVEHLLMIGGPNDVVIESQIIRAENRESRDVRDARSREKEFRDREARDTSEAVWPSAEEMPLPASPQRSTPVPAAATLERSFSTGAGSLAEDTMPALPHDGALPAAKGGAFQFAQRRPSPPVIPAPKVPAQREPLGGRADASQKPESGAGLPREVRRAPVATPFLRPSSLRQTDGAAVRLTPPGAAETQGAGANFPRPVSGSEESPASPELNLDVEIGPLPLEASAGPAASASARGLSENAAVQADVDTLEAEMAKLLGRRSG